MTAYEQRSYPGAAADTLLNADITSGALTFSVSPGTGNNYPDGSGGPFFVAIDYDVSKSEKIRVTSRINDTFTIATVVDRGYDGTTAQAHSAGAKVRAVWTATDAQEANRAAANTVGQVTAKGDLIAGTAANALGKVAVGGDGLPLVADSTKTTGVAYARLSTTNLTGAWSLDDTYLVDGVNGAYVRVARYVIVGNTLHLTGKVTFSGPSLGIVYARSFLSGSRTVQVRDGVDYAAGVCNFSAVAGPGTVFVDNATGNLKFQFGAFGDYLGAGVSVSNGNALWFTATVEIN